MQPTDELPLAIEAALQALDPHFRVQRVDNVSMMVSTNRVYRLHAESGQELFAKLSSYGSYVHFREDHQLIHQWATHLRHTPYEHFLAPIATLDGRPFTFRSGQEWVAFYHKVPFYDFLPKCLSDGQVEALGREMALFHRESDRVASYMDGSWKSTGSDIARLYDLLGTPEFQHARGMSEQDADMVREHCDHFLERAGALGYHRMRRIPVLVDWNITNFSVGLDADGFKFFSRWDYDWFRLEPRVMDFYFCARVVRNEGDRTVFSYTADPFFEPRFMRFLRAYHQVFPLTETDVLYIRESYRFFVLNYVLRAGEHFFRPDICARLQHEAIRDYLPSFQRWDFSQLLAVLT